MSVERFYPYSVAPHSMRLVLDTPDVDIATGSDGSLLAYEREEPRLRIIASIALPSDVWGQVFPPKERSAPPAKVCLVAQSIESRRRERWVAEGDGVYELDLQMDRKEWAGTAEFQAVLVRSSHGDRVPVEYAASRGSLLSWARPCRIVFDQPRQPPGRFLQVEWRPFDESENAWLRRHAEHLFAIDNRTAPPTLVLNSSIPGARTVLESRGTRGAKARVRDMTYNMIAHQVWSSLLASTLDHLACAEPSPGDDSAPIEELEDWEQAVIEDWAPILFPEEEAENAMDVLARAVRQPDHRDEILQRRLPTAVQSRLMSFRGFDRLVQEMIR